jgi:hypothetical protein
MGMVRSMIFMVRVAPSAEKQAGQEQRKDMLNNN